MDATTAKILERAKSVQALLAAPAAALRKRAARLPAPVPIGYYLTPARPDLAAWHAPGLPDKWAAVVAGLLEEAGPFTPVRLPDAGPSPESRWVKAAYSHALRTGLEYANFFPGQYPGGIPNHATPLAALLTSALLGAGLGWGGGRLLESVLPAGYGGRLKRTGLVLGGLLGAGLGSAPGVANLAGGRSFNDPLPFGAAPDEPPDYSPEPGEAATGSGLESKLPKPWSGPAEPPGGWRLKRGSQDYYGSVIPAGMHPADVHLPDVSGVLDAANAQPNYRSGVLGPLYAAALEWSPRRAEGWATADQLGRLAAKAGTDYLRGLAVGAAINQTIGTPHAATGFGAAGLAAGLLGAVVPKLFGY